MLNHLEITPEIKLLIKALLRLSIAYDSHTEDCSGGLAIKYAKDVLECLTTSTSKKTVEELLNAKT